MVDGNDVERGKDWELGNGSTRGVAVVVAGLLLDPAAVGPTTCALGGTCDWSVPSLALLKMSSMVVVVRVVSVMLSKSRLLVRKEMSWGIPL